MSDNKIHLKIITPEKVVYDNKVDAIYAQGIKGSFGILPNHTPFMSVLAIGIAKIELNNNIDVFSIMGGAFQFKNNEAVILTEAAEMGSDIDTARAQMAKERAEAMLGNAETSNDVKIANNALTRAMVRLKAASKNFK